MTTSEPNTRDAYNEAGVDIDLATDLLDRVKTKIAATQGENVLAPIGGFGGLFHLKLEGYRDPVLVTSIDGVGTKLMVARMAENYTTVGIDLVNHCVNDIAVQGAKPLSFMDYLGIGKLRSPLYEQVLEGLADACAAQGVALTGGETAEMPGMYGDDFDLVGAIVGIVERDAIVTGAEITAGHKLIGLASNRLHTNRYSLARRGLFELAGYTVADTPAGLNTTVGDALLRPHTCYWPAIQTALQNGVNIDGMAHITGGGWFDNITRVLPEGTAAVCDTGALPVPDIMALIRDRGDISEENMYRTFNMGMGMAWMVPPDHVQSAIESCSAEGIQAAVAGDIIAGDKRVTLRHVA